MYNRMIIRLGRVNIWVGKRTRFGIEGGVEEDPFLTFFFFTDGVQLKFTFL